MAEIKVKPWDSAAMLKTEGDIAGYMTAAREENDPALLAHALDVIAKARGMMEKTGE